jgi:hypothetical protein
MQVIIDNAQAFKAIGSIIERRYDHIVWTPCVHSVNLALKAIDLQVPSTKELCEIAKVFKLSSQTHQHAQAMYICEVSIIEGL